MTYYYSSEHNLREHSPHPSDIMLTPDAAAQDSCGDIISLWCLWNEHSEFFIRFYDMSATQTVLISMTSLRMHSPITVIGDGFQWKYIVSPMKVSRFDYVSKKIPVWFRFDW